MKKPVFTILAVAAAMVMSGCATVYRVSESAPAPMHPQHAPGRPPMRNPSVAVKAAPADAKSARLASSLKASVEGDFAARGFDVGGKKADSVVSIEVSRREAARLSDWRTYEGTVSARVVNSASGRLVASESFKALGERALDEGKAEAAVKDALSKQVSAWLAKTLPAKKVALPPNPPPPDHAVATVAISPKDASEDPKDILRVQRRFMDYVASHPGILSCKLVREDPARREFSFEVVYETQAFPGGLLNTIVLGEPRLGGNVELEIVR